MNQEIYNDFLIVVALASIISPIITTIINSCFKFQITKMKIKSDNLKRANDLIIRVYENYLRSAGAVLVSSDLQIQEDYAKSHALIMIHVPTNVFEDIQMFNEFISDKSWEHARDKFKDITSKLREIVENMSR